MFNGANVLVTGGTGSFGKKFIRAVLDNYSPNKVIIFSRDELKQFEMEQEFQSDKLRFFIGDVRDAERLKMAFKGVDYVIHAAALKQVPAAEYNPQECIKTNIDGAMNVVAAAIDTNVKKVIALSTDKAAGPVNLYGASKLASDKLFTAANNLAGSAGPRFAVVRYGNVIGSRGSVIPFFKKLVADGAEFIPITDARMTRFWISLEAGIDLVFRAFERMQGGEIYIPKIPSMNIMDLVEAVAPGIPTKIVGIRPGEKIHELMCPQDLDYMTLEFENHYVIKPTYNDFDRSIDYTINNLGEKGKPVLDGFEYSSGTNEHFLTVEELKAGAFPEKLRPVLDIRKTSSKENKSRATA